MANAGWVAGPLRANRSATPTPTSPSVLPARIRGRRSTLVRPARPGWGRAACAGGAPRSRARSRQRLSVNLLIAVLLLSQPGPRPGQPLAKCDTGYAKRDRRILGAEP